MSKKVWVLFIACCSMLLLISCGQKSSNHETKKVTQPVPTVFIHGLMGSSKSTNKMIRAAEKSGHAKKVLTINVQANGKLQVVGKYQRQAANPIIQVNFVNNEASIQTQTQWLTTTLHWLRTKYKIKNFNAVAHSAGNVTLLETEMTANKSIPQLKRLVIIAGPFNGVIGMNDAANTNRLGKNYKPKIIYPANDWYPSYSQLLSWRHNFPKNVRVLNIYGDLADGTHSDGMVTEQSELSVNYLLRGLTKSIKNVKISGPNAGHSDLHNNKTVDQLIIKFLWSNN